MQVFNDTSQQIVLIKSEGYTVVRGNIRPDGTIDFHLPTCFPTVQGVPCADDYIVQLANQTKTQRYTRRVAGHLRSYATTPPSCPPDGDWRTRFRFRWANGAVDNVVTTQPCQAE